jgi:hypothetical protein
VKWTRTLSVAVALGLVLVTFGALGASTMAPQLHAPEASMEGSPVAGLRAASGPVISVTLSVSPSAIDAGQSIHVSTTATGGDPSPSYIYDYFGMPMGCSADEAQSFTCTPSQVGSFNSIYVNVTDGAGNGTNSVDSQLTVYSDMQVTLSVTPQQITSGQSINIQTNVNYGWGPFTYDYNGLPSSCMSGQGQSFSCNPNTGDYNITVNVTDSTGASVKSGNQYVQVSSSSGSGGGGGGGNNSSNPFGSLLSGFSGILSLLLIAGIIGFATWILLIVGVWIIAVVLIRRLPKRGTAAAAMLAGQTTKCASCSAVIPANTKFCPECGTSTTASATPPKSP